MIHMVKEMDRSPALSGPEILKSITILDAILWLNSAWREVETQNIVKCFSKAGFHQELCDQQLVNDCDSGDEDDDVPLAAVKLSRELFGCEFRELVDIDSTVCTCDSDMKDWEGRSASELLEELEGKDDCEDEQEEFPGDTEEDVMTLSDAIDMVGKLKWFSVSHGYTDMLMSLGKIEESLSLEPVTTK